MAAGFESCGAIMTESSANSAVGREKPPGPAKLAKLRFHRALYAALEGSVEEIEGGKGENVIAAIAQRAVLDAVAGKASARRLVLGLLDAECERADNEAADAGAEANEAVAVSLLQGKTQGNGKESLEEILWPDDPWHEFVALPDDKDDDMAATNLLSAGAIPKPDNRAEPLSLLQGKKQGNGKEKPLFFGAAPGADHNSWNARSGGRKSAALMMSSADVTLRNSARFVPPRNGQIAKVRKSIAVSP
jgi:hypothetical protein